jgi:hypothetical protein
MSSIPFTPEASVSGWHFDPEHVAPAQSWPQAPQFAASFVRSKHATPHGEKPAVHRYEHAPIAHDGAAFATAVVHGVHIVPHVFSDVLSAHAPAQR